MKFDPTVNSGTLLQILVVLCSAVAIYTGIRNDQVQNRADIDAVKAASAVDREQTKAALAEIKSDLKELSKVTGDMKESLGILRGGVAANGRGSK